MPGPSTKEELLEEGERAYSQIQDTLGSLTRLDLESTFSFAHRDRCVRDVLAHLLEWQQLFGVWYRKGMGGGVPEMPAPGFTWKDTRQLNRTIWENCQEATLRSVRARLTRSHRKMMKLIAGHTDTELFEKKRYPWTGSTSLGSYFVSATSSHYAWAIKLLRRHQKSLT